MFTIDTTEALTYTPDFERENYLQAQYALLEKKIAFFSLPHAEIKKLISAGNDIENSCIVAFGSQPLNSYQPEDIYAFCLAVEENHSQQITHFEAWQNQHLKNVRIDKADGILLLINALTKNGGQEFSAAIDIGALKACLAHLQQPKNGGFFTQSWILRMVMQILQPFKNFAYSYPALVQALYLEYHKKNMMGLLSPNLATLKNKEQIDELLLPLKGITAGALRSVDLTPLLQVGYDIIEESLQRTDGLLKQLYRQKVGYAKKEPRIRNLLNYLYAEGIEHLEPHMPEFNERQQQIIKYLFAKRYLGTKELTLDFKCDRKTIQRDFVKLHSTEVIKSTGNGSALKYCINLKNNGYDMLEIYSMAVRKRDDFQETLFGEEIWETKKA